MKKINNIAGQRSGREIARYSDEEDSGRRFADNSRSRFFMQQAHGTTMPRSTDKTSTERRTVSDNSIPGLRPSTDRRDN